MDPELEAMQALVGALTPLEPDAQQRVIAWAANRFGLVLAAPKKGLGGKAEIDEEADDAPAEPAKKVGAHSFETLGELFDAAGPKTNGHRAVVVGYWLQTKEGLTDLDAGRVNKELKHLGYEVANITTAMDQMKATKPAYIIQLKKSGTSQQARKKYKVTEAGIKVVESVLRGEEWK